MFNYNQLKEKENEDNFEKFIENLGKLANIPLKTKELSKEFNVPFRFN